MRVVHSCKSLVIRPRDLFFTEEDHLIEVGQFLANNFGLDGVGQDIEEELLEMFVWDALCIHGPLPKPFPNMHIELAERLALLEMVKSRTPWCNSTGQPLQTNHTEGRRASSPYFPK